MAAPSAYPSCSGAEPLRRVRLRRAGVVAFFVFFLLVLPIGTVQAQGAHGTRFMDLSQAESDAVLARVRALPLTERLDLLSTFFFGTPYGHDPLGEGERDEFDRDPEFRLDQVDCITFIETLLAMSRSKSLSETRALLPRIRYQGVPSYPTRRHIVWSQWLPGLVELGFLEDITAKIAPGATSRQQLGVTDPSQCAPSWRDFCLRLGPHFPREQVEHDMVGVDWVLRNPDTIPSGSLMLIVLVERPGIPYRVTHLGLVLRDPKGRAVLRHASKTTGLVVEQPLLRYVAGLKRRYEKRPVAGLMFARIKDAEPSGKEFEKPVTVPHP